MWTIITYYLADPYFVCAYLIERERFVMTANLARFEDDEVTTDASNQRPFNRQNPSI